MGSGVFVAGGRYASVHARAYVYCEVVAVCVYVCVWVGGGHNVRATHRFCLVATLAKNLRKMERPNFGTDASGSFHEQLHFRICQGKSQWAPRNTSLQKKKVTHRPSPALPHTSVEIGETIVTAPQTRTHALGFARGKLTSTQTPAASAHELSDLQKRF